MVTLYLVSNKFKETQNNISSKNDFKEYSKYFGNSREEALFIFIKKCSDNDFKEYEKNINNNEEKKLFHFIKEVSSKILAEYEESAGEYEVLSKEFLDLCNELVKHLKLEYYLKRSENLLRKGKEVSLISKDDIHLALIKKVFEKKPTVFMKKLTAKITENFKGKSPMSIIIKKENKSERLIKAYHNGSAKDKKSIFLVSREYDSFYYIIINFLPLDYLFKFDFKFKVFYVDSFKVNFDKELSHDKSKVQFIKIEDKININKAKIFLNDLERRNNIFK